jgi:hypothetical protein
VSLAKDAARRENHEMGKMEVCFIVVCVVWCMR